MISEGVDVEGNNGETLHLKKGPWTAEEDEILTEHVRKYGEGRWSAVQKYSGLARCGKSCRLRWANHLRPDLKKGSLTPDEERLILELQAKYGNKWARIAAELPGRTDNEIKNFWNSRIKRRTRDPNQINMHGQQSYSSQPTTPTTLSSDFQFQFLTSPLPPRSPLTSTSSSSLPFTINRPPPLLSSPSRFKRHRRLSTLTDLTPLSPTGFNTSPNMSSTSLLFSSSMSANHSLLSSPSTPCSARISPLGSQNSPMQSSLFSSWMQPASPLSPQCPALFSSLSQPNSPRLTSLTRPNSRMIPSLSMPNLSFASQAGSQVLSSPGAPGSPILSLVGSTSPMINPGEHYSSNSLFRNAQSSELSGSACSFMFDGVSSDASGYMHNYEQLPSNQLQSQNANLANWNSYDVVLDQDPSQSDVILELKMKAGWTRGLKKKTRLDVGHGSMMNIATARVVEELSKDEMDKQRGLEATFDSGHSQAELEDSCGLLDDMLKESQALEEAIMTSGTETCLVFTEENHLLGVQNDSINSHLQSSAGDDKRDEQALEHVNSIHDDLSKMLDFDSSSLTVPELYLD